MLYFPNDFGKIWRRMPVGGLGSGRHASEGCHVDFCESSLAIDLSKLKRDGYLFSGCRGEFKWRRRGQVIGSVDYRVEQEGLRLIYRIRPRGGQWRDVVEVIVFDRTPTQFGGERIWLVCPGCQTRRRILYGGTFFRCRQCHGLRYESQYLDPLSRLLERWQKLRERLGSVGSLDDPFPPKPKGMHWATYRRLLQRDEELAEQWEAEIADRLRCAES